MSDKWKKELHPELVRRIGIVMVRAAKDGYELRVVSGYRSHAEQNELYAKGRSRPGRRVTNARGGQSWHNFGLAADLAPVIDGEIYWGETKFNWSLIGRWANLAGLEWGGNWKTFKDRPHVQLRLGLELGDAQKLYRAHLNTLTGVWDHVARKAFREISTKELVAAAEDIKKLEPAVQAGNPTNEASHKLTPPTQTPKTEPASRPTVPAAPAQTQPVQDSKQEAEAERAKFGVPPLGGQARTVNSSEKVTDEHFSPLAVPQISLLSKLMIFWREALGIAATTMGFVTRNWHWFLIALALIALAAWLYNESKKRADARIKLKIAEARTQ